MNCTSCGQPITLLSSQKNGNLDTCLQCALEQASFVRYVLKRRTEVIHDDVICQAHYQEDGLVLLQPLSDREKLAGYTQTVQPYVGDRGCASCAEEQVRAGTSDARVMGRE